MGEDSLLCEVLGLPAAAARTGLEPVPAFLGSGCVRAGGVLEWVSPDVGPSDSTGPVLGLMHSVLGWRPCPSWAAGPDLSSKGDLGSTGHFRKNSRAVGCYLELSLAPGRLDSSCFPSSVPPGPVCARPQANLC